MGERLAAAAGRMVYGAERPFCGPRYARFEVEGGRVRVHLENLDEGLAGRGPRLEGFALAGQDRQFHPAGARIEGASVVLWSAAVPEPVAARYAWASAPAISLFDANGLPALPFRTDAWPGRTEGRVEPEAY